jgi:hypothetical protein
MPFASTFQNFPRIRQFQALGDSQIDSPLGRHDDADGVCIFRTQAIPDDPRLYIYLFNRLGDRLPHLHSRRPSQLPNFGSERRQKLNHLFVCAGIVRFSGCFMIFTLDRFVAGNRNHSTHLGYNPRSVFKLPSLAA